MSASEPTPSSKDDRKRMTVPRFREAKSRGEKLAVLTAYDFPSARLFDQSGIDAILVGDTLGVVVQGNETTLPVTMDEMVYHTRMVARAAQKSLVIADLPFLSFATGTDESIRNAGRLLKEGGAQSVKLEGGVLRENLIAAIVDAEIPVCGHIGLTPQSIRRIGRYGVQRGESRLLDDARAVEQAGAFAIVLESIPLETAQKITETLSIPTIGIGAGPHCDGQVLVWYDAMGWSGDFRAKFVKRYVDLEKIVGDGVKQYCREVKSGEFPDQSHNYTES